MSLVGSVVTISPPANYVGQVVATYTIRDGLGLTATSSITLTVQEPLNRPPDARDDGADVVDGGSATVSVLLNDSDPDGDPLSVSIVSSADPSLGSTSLNANQTVSFTATPGATGTAVIIYEVSDGELTDTAALRVNLLSCSESAPVASDGFLKTGYRQPIAVDLNAFGSNGTFVDVAGPSGFGNGLYTPPEGENGNVVISYAVVNSCGLRATGRITIDVNQEPVGVPKSLSAFRGESVVVPVTDLATDAEALSITSLANAPAWVTRETDRLVIAPSVGVASGASSFTARIADPGGLAVVVNVTVTIQSRPPVANPDTVDVTNGNSRIVDLVANDTHGDSEGALVVVELLPTTITFSGGGTGTVVPDAGGRVVVDPGSGRGVGTFTYRVRDADGATSGPAIVTVNAPPADQLPTATDQSISVSVGTSTVVELEVSGPEGRPLRIVGSTFSDPDGVVTDTDGVVTDPDGVVTDPSGLRLSILATVPGTFKVTYQVTDGEATSAPATLTVVASAPTTTTTTPTTTTTTMPTTTTTTPTTTSTTTTTTTRRRRRPRHRRPGRRRRVHLRRESPACVADQSVRGERVERRSERRLSRHRRRCQRVRAETTACSTEPRHDAASSASRSGCRGVPNVAELDKVASRRSCGEASGATDAPPRAISASVLERPMSKPASTSASVADAQAPRIRSAGSCACSRRRRRRYLMPMISPAAISTGSTMTIIATEPLTAHMSTADSALSVSVSAISSSVVSVSDSGGGAIGGCGAAGVCVCGSGGGGAPSAASSAGTGS